MQVSWTVQEEYEMEVKDYVQPIGIEIWNVEESAFSLLKKRVVKIPYISLISFQVSE